MPGPTSPEERRRAMRRVAAGVAAVVGVSAGTTAYASGGTATESVLVAVAGLVFGVLLVLVVGRG